MNNPCCRQNDIENLVEAHTPAIEYEEEKKTLNIMANSQVYYCRDNDSSDCMHKHC